MRAQDEIVSRRDAVAITAGRFRTFRASWIAALPTPPPPLIWLAKALVSRGRAGWVFDHYRRKNRKALRTYDQNPNILSRLDLEPIVQRLIRCRKCQPIARRLHEIQHFWLESASEFADELILCIAALPSGGSYVGDVVTGFEPLAVWPGL